VVPYLARVFMDKCLNSFTKNRVPASKINAMQCPLYEIRAGAQTD
jgi:hypothetical protein